MRKETKSLLTNTLYIQVPFLDGYIKIPKMWHDQPSHELKLLRIYIPKIPSKFSIIIYIAKFINEALC